MIGAVPLEVAGSLLGLSDLLERAYNFLKDARESRELNERLRNALRSSLQRYSESIKASMESGKILRTQVATPTVSISAEDIGDLLQSAVNFLKDFEGLLSSVLDFSKQCHILVSDFPDFMRRVESKKPKVHAILDFFGKHYDPESGSVDITTIPMLFRLYGSKVKKKESAELTKEMAQHRKVVSIAIQKAMLIKRLRLRTRKKYLVKQFQVSLQKMLEAVAKLKTTEDIDSQLSGNAPPWIGDLSEIIEDVRKAMPDLTRHSRKEGKLLGKTAFAYLAYSSLFRFFVVRVVVVVANFELCGKRSSVSFSCLSNS